MQMGLFFNKKNDEDSTRNDIAKVISFLNQKGGVGKTTMCFNAAYALAKQGNRVLCIDMDPQANLSLLFGAELSEEDYSIHHLLVNSIRELKGLHCPALVGDVIIPGKKGVDLLPSSQDLSGFDLTVSGITGARPLILKKFIEKSGLTELYDYIIVDCPPTLGLLVVNVLCASDGVMVPFRPDEFSKKGLGHLYSVLEDIEDMGVTQIPDVLAHIPNLVDVRRKQEMLDLDYISKVITEEMGEDARMVSPFFNRSQLVRSQAQRKSVFEYNSKDFLPLQEQFTQLATIIKDWDHAEY